MDASATSRSRGIGGAGDPEQRESVVELLGRAYWMEIGIVMSYIAVSINLAGVRAQEVKDSLTEEVDEKLDHAKQFAERIKDLSGVVPGSEEIRTEQGFLGLPAEQTDVGQVIRGAIEAETAAIEHCTRIVEETERVDPVTQDMVIEILRDQQSHRCLFESILREYELEATGLASE